MFDYLGLHYHNLLQLEKRLWGKNVFARCKRPNLSCCFAAASPLTCPVPLWPTGHKIKVWGGTLVTALHIISPVKVASTPPNPLRSTAAFIGLKLIFFKIILLLFQIEQCSTSQTPLGFCLYKTRSPRPWSPFESKEAESSIFFFWCNVRPHLITLSCLTHYSLNSAMTNG